jgi:hypothetical protein
MDYQPRTIAFLAELFHPPLPMDPQPIQKLHNAMFETGQPAYASFAVTPAGPVLSNPPARPGAASQVAFLADRVQFREELGITTSESFSERLVSIMSEAAPLRGIEVVHGHQVTLRSLINPRHYRDSRKFLKDAVFGIDEEIESFERSPHLYGLRLVFPPEGEETNAFALRVESYNADLRSLYVEVQGTFGPIVVARGMHHLEASVGATYRFLLDRVLPFVARFDERQPS